MKCSIDSYLLSLMTQKFLFLLCVVTILFVVMFRYSPPYKINYTMGLAREMAQSVKSLLYKHEGLSSTPRTHI